MLNKRLRAIADLLEPCESLFDIGSDHGFLPMYLLLEKKINKAVIGEISVGPLSQAKKNFERYPELNCEFVLSDGLRSYDEISDSVVIAGMGFETIQHIVLQDLSKFRKVSQIIIQSSTKVDQLRRFLNSNNFHIIDEEIIKDRKYYYSIIKVKYSIVKEILSEEEIQFGPILIKKYNSVFEQYLLFCRRIENDILIAQKKESSLRIQLIDQLIGLNKNLD